jgi:hypothetical protein
MKVKYFKVKHKAMKNSLDSQICQAKLDFFQNGRHTCCTTGCVYLHQIVFEAINANVFRF